MSWALPLQPAARWLAYPALMGASVLAVGAATARGIREEFAVLAVCTGAAIAVVALERWLPFERAWLRDHGDSRVNACHLVFSTTLAELGRTLLMVGLLRAAILLSAAAGGSAWPDAWPLAAQLGLALLVGGFGEYWAHRILHETWLFRFHAVHHSAPRLYWLSAFRLHPLDSLWSSTFAFLPLVLLGCPPPALTAFAVYGVVHAMFQHSNVDVRLGPFNRVLSMVEVHRFHHSRLRAEMDANYGSVLLIWDTVFGTRFVPEPERRPSEVGLTVDAPAFPRGYLAQLRAPFARTTERAR